MYVYIYIYIYMCIYIYAHTHIEREAPERLADPGVRDGPVLRVAEGEGYY